MKMGVLTILAMVFALGATVMAFIFLVPEKKRANMGKLGKFLHDLVNFRFLIIEKILQAVYIFATASAILIGFFMLFYVESYGWHTRWYGGYGLLVMILGPIGIRIVYEFMMMAILLLKNVIQINNKMKTPDGEKTTDVFSVPTKEDFVEAEPVAPAAPAAPVAPVAPAAPVTPFCTSCGARRNPDGTCPNGCQ